MEMRNLKMSIERSIKVTVNGKEIEATAFVTSPNRASTDGPISQRFVEALISGAKQSGLPDSYVASIKSKAV